MGTTQAEIAKRVGLDVSSVNKILSGLSRGVFKATTVARVKKAAKRLGYDFTKPSKGTLVNALMDLCPPILSADEIAKKSGLSAARVEEIKILIKRAGGALIVLLVLRSVIGG
jgi:hypothetical protein